MMLLPVHAAMLASQQNYLQILKFGTHIGQLILLPFFPNVSRERYMDRHRKTERERKRVEKKRERLFGV